MTDNPRPQISVTPPAANQVRWSRWLIVATALYWLAMFIGTHVSQQRGPLFEADVSDKFLHFGGYGGLAALLAAAAILRWRPGLGMIVAIVALLAAYGAVDELTQKLVGRDCELLDWCADVLGSFVGCSAVVGVALARRRRKAG